MARTTIPIAQVPSFQRGLTMSPLAGDSANDHDLDLTKGPRLFLVGRNFHAGNVSFDVILPAGPSNYYSAVTQTITVASGAVFAIRMDVPPDLWQTGGLLHIDSVDANYASLFFSAVIYDDTNAL